MPSFNRVTLLGHLGRDPEMKGENTQYCQFSLATTYKPKTGDKVTVWHYCKAFGSLAEIICNYAHKGSLVLVEGRIDYYEHEREGVKVKDATIIVDNIQLLDKKEN